MHSNTWLTDGALEGISKSGEAQSVRSANQTEKQASKGRQ